MASVASASPGRRTPPSAADSGNSNPHSPKSNQVESATNNGVSHTEEKKLDLPDELDHLDSTECIERFRKYDAEYTRRLMAKYFSGKTVFGGNNIFDEQITIGDEIIKSSRLPCFRSYTDPVVGVEEQSSNGSTTIPNGKHLPKKN
ncbi:hypothetical protein HN51_059845 [Arachis hypogaea]|uniref:Uncharacterized protein n=1 Tax=Arachis hypogaea TaxID=3818 RepID=A0A444X7G8_ARAHY|nr:uncharacterized protein LOC107623926 [Arachis ipaensis]XP_025683725.1 uncharacterized protein LOC112784650 [Arachis hypogaea]QHN83338.1 uncharacterized protein DS421_20g703900 [Arachis hypogaea]RYQ85612.1 hypothetical protein Ahy_B10g105179 [Arachis hypogaea]